MMPEQQQRILGYFIEEAKDHLNTIEQGLLNLQATIEDSEMVNEVFRAAHSVKGGAAMLGINSMQRTAHRLEDYFKILKESPAKVDRTLESMFLQVFDGLQSLLEELQGPFGLTEDKAQEVMQGLEPVFGRLEEHLNTLVAASSPPETAATVASAATPQTVSASSGRTPKTTTPSSEVSALNLVFKSDVPVHLREMLALFKQADTDVSRQALQICCEALERIGEQFDLDFWCNLTSAAHQAVGNHDQTYRALAPIIIKELKQAQEQVLAGRAGDIAISDDLQALMPSPIATDEVIDDELDALLTDAIPASTDSPLDLFEEESPALTAETDLDWLETPTSADGDDIGAADDDFLTSLESFSSSTDDTATVQLEGANSEEPSVGTSELNSLADLFEGEMANLESPWEEISEASDTATSNTGPDLSIPDDFSDLLENTLDDDAAAESHEDLTDLFSSAPVAAGNSAFASDILASDTGSEDTAATDDFDDLFESSPVSSDSDDIFLAAEANSDEDQDLDNLLESISSEHSSAYKEELESAIDAGDALGMEATFDDLGELFEEGSNADFSADLGDVSLETMSDLVPDNSETPPEAANTIATGSDELLEDLWGSGEVASDPDPDGEDSDHSDLLFDDILDPWATEEAEDDIADESALDALDELWSESQEDAEIEIPVGEPATPATEDEFQGFADLDLDLSDTADEASAVEMPLTSNTEATDDFPDLFEESLEESTDISETALNFEDIGILEEAETNSEDLDALLSSSLDASEVDAEARDLDLDILLSDELDDVGSGVEVTEPDFSGDLEDVLGDPSVADPLFADADLADTDLSAMSEAIADNPVPPAHLSDVPYFDDASANDSLFENLPGDSEILGDNLIENHLDLDDLSEEGLQDTDIAIDLPAELDDAAPDSQADIFLDIDNDAFINDDTSDIDNLFETSGQTESRLDIDDEVALSTDTEAFDDLFGADDISPVTDESAAIGAEFAALETDPVLHDAPSNSAAIEDTTIDSLGVADNELDNIFGSGLTEDIPHESGLESSGGLEEDFFGEELQSPSDVSTQTSTDLLDLDQDDQLDSSEASPLDAIGFDDLLNASPDAIATAPAETSSLDDITDFFEEPQQSLDTSATVASDDFFGTPDELNREEFDNDSHAPDVLDLEEDALLGTTDDVFGTPALDTEVVDLFEDPAPDTEAAIAASPDTEFPIDAPIDADDLFGTPAHDTEVADLFEDADSDTEAVLDSLTETELPIDAPIDADDLFGTPAHDTEVADLFEDGDSDTEAVLDSLTETELPIDAPIDADDLFGTPAHDTEVADLFEDADSDTEVVLDSLTETELPIDAPIDADDLFGTPAHDTEVADLFDDADSDTEAVIDALTDNELPIDAPVSTRADFLFEDEAIEGEMANLLDDPSLDEEAIPANNDTVANEAFALDNANISIPDANDLFSEGSLDEEISDLFGEIAPASEPEATADIAAIDDGAINLPDAEQQDTEELFSEPDLEDIATAFSDDELQASDLDSALTSAEITHDFATLVSPADEESIAPPTEADTSLDELDALLADEPAEPDASSDFDELDALLEDSPEEPPASLTNSETVDFDELDSLLEEDTPLPSVDSESLNASEEDEFSDLEKLLEEADQTLGGSSPTIRAKPGSRISRRVGTMVDQTMRVSVKHLDTLNNLVGELVVNRNSLEQDQDRLRQFLDNLQFQVQQLNDVGQRMRDLYERSLLESSLMSSRQSLQGSSIPRVSESHGSGNGGTVGHATGATFDALEMDRFTGFHTLSQEMIELIVRVRESASDIGYTVESSDQITRQFRQVTTQLQEGLNKARMVPFAQTADRLPRAVRDISLKCGKEARLIVEGRDTLIDKMILERLYDPMTHLVNNAITHGIETPEERSALGKPPEGAITVRAFYQGNQTVIYIADDGGGIDPDLVKRKAVKQGILTPAEANSMSVLETYELLFRPGFSTRDQADAFAGRGVGMDVVRTALSEIRGSITIDSEMGKGTSFTIRLPLTLSISKALSCLNNQARIAFPMDGVEDMFDVPQDRIQIDENEQSSIQWRDTKLTFQPLADLLQFNRSLGRGRVYGGNQDEDAVSIVVLRSANTFIGLQVDRVLGEQEIVIKQLEGPVPKPMGIAGATVLGDGRVMPIADVLELIDIAQGRVRREAGSSLWTQSEEPPTEELVATKSEPTVLIVDDSITVRELLSMSFNKVGYRVEQARDGQEAWEKLRSGLPCDLVFCDIEMPRMDGLELLSRLQKDTALKRIPIAMLTSRGADRHRQMALDLGANGYFTKPYLEEALLDAAQRMLNGEILLKPDSE
ncbi:MAG: response regulator [Cyanobacteria bacterium J06639_14]